MNDLRKMKALGLCLMGFVVCGAYAASVFDDAKVWWKFDQGGADGTVVTANQIHDARNAGQGVPTAMYGAQGGPLWSVLDVRLPYQRRTVRSTALHLPCDTRMNGETPQFFSANLAFSGLQEHGSAMTVVARVRFEGNGVSAADSILWNNAFDWGNNYGTAFGFIKGNNGQRGATTTYVPYVFIGKNTFGGAQPEKIIPMKVGEWYDVAYLFSEEEVEGTRYDVVTFVVADVAGLHTQTLRKASKRVAAANTTYGCLGVMQNGSSDWKTYNATIKNNSGDSMKNFDGWVHQLAVWGRALTLDEVQEAFGRPAENPEQDVFADASNWVRFDKDLNGDSKLQFDEIRDVHHWNRPQDGQTIAVSQAGPLGGPVWTNMNVYLPGRGVTIQSPCLYFPITTNVSVNASGETIFSAFPTTLRLGNTLRSGSYTVLARIYPHQLVGNVSGETSFFYNNGLDWGSKSGSEFGIQRGNDATGNTFYPKFILSQSTYQASSLTMCTNNWYDIAFSITDNGYDADGKALTDTALVAVQDAEHGFRYEVVNVGTNAFPTFASWDGKALVGSENIYTLMTDFRNDTTKTAINFGNSAKSFRGMIHQLAIWNRALTTNEIAAAFRQTGSMVMSVGSADGANGEFAGTEGSYDCNVDDTGIAWRDIAGTLDADHTELTLRFTPDANNVDLVHYLHVKAAAVGVAEGQKALLSLRVNDRSVATAKAVGAYDDLWCVLPHTLLKKGSNVLKISYQGGTASSFTLDSAEIVGSWQLGVKNGSVGEFSQEGSGRGPHFYLGNRNMKNVLRAVTMGWKNNYLHFYMPAELAAKHAFRFSSVMVDRSADAVVDGVIRVLLNGEEKYLSPRDAVDGRAPFTFDVEPGELKAGWNTIQPQYLHTAGWLSFDYFRFEISDYNPATFLIVR